MEHNASRDWKGMLPCHLRYHASAIGTLYANGQCPNFHLLRVVAFGATFPGTSATERAHHADHQCSIGGCMFHNPTTTTEQPNNRTTLAIDPLGID
jgi:hypothetical protein